MAYALAAGMIASAAAPSSLSDNLTLLIPRAWVTSSSRLRRSTIALRERACNVPIRTLR